MTIKKRWKAFSLGLFIFALPAAHSAGFLHSFVHSAQQFEELLILRGHSVAEAQSLLAARQEAFLALTGERESLSASELLTSLKGLPVEGAQDQQLQRSLLALINQEENQISSRELAQIFNQLNYLSHRYGKRASTVLACGQCVDSNLLSSGIRYGLGSVVGTDAKKLMEQIPTGPKDLKRYLINQMRQANLGDYSKVAVSQVAPEEERSLALFLAMKNSPNPYQRELYQKIMALSGGVDNQVTQLFNPEHTHKLWKIFADDPSEEEVRGWSVLLEEVRQSRAEAESLESAFYGVLENRARSNPALAQKLETLKTKNCYFR